MPAKKEKTECIYSIDSAGLWVFLKVGQKNLPINDRPIVDPHKQKFIIDNVENGRKWLDKK